MDNFLYICGLKSSNMEIDIYTDASWCPKTETGQISAFIIDEDENEYHFIQRIEKSEIISILKDENNSNNYKTGIDLFELYSIYTILNKFSVLSNIKLNIYTDCFSCFTILNGTTKIRPTKTPLKYNLYDKIKKINILPEFEIRWIRAHCGVYGNAKADKLTRKTSEQIKNLHHLHWGVNVQNILKTLSA